MNRPSWAHGDKWEGWGREGIFERMYKRFGSYCFYVYEDGTLRYAKFFVTSDALKYATPDIARTKAESLFEGLK